MTAPAPATGLTRYLAGRAAGATGAWLSPPVRQAAGAAIADCIACALAGSRDPVLDAVARNAVGGAAAGEASLWGRGERAGARDAALANATAAHLHALDDTHESMRGHPSAPVLPAVMALAEPADAGGAEVLLAYVVGVEIAGRLGRAMNDHHATVGWHTTATIGTLAAAAACARLLGLDAARTGHALGLAASMAGGLRVNFGTPTKALHAGLAAQHGLQAATLARDGLEASPRALEGHEGLLELFCGPGGHDAARAIAAAGEPLQLLVPGIVLKRYPTCSLMHALIDEVLGARQTAAPPAGAAATVTATSAAATAAWPRVIRCRISPRLDAARRVDWPMTGLQAKFHVPYCVATAWLRGSQDIGDFVDGAVGDAGIRALAERVRVEINPQAADGDHALLEIELEDGRRIHAERVKPLGHPSRPFSEADRLAKCHGLAAPVIGTAASRRLWAVLGDLAGLPSIRTVTGLLRPAA